MNLLNEDRKQLTSLRVGIQYPVGLPGEHDGVDPQPQHEQDDQHLDGKGEVRSSL